MPAPNVTTQITTDILRTFYPVTSSSTNWTHWMTTVDARTCARCIDLHGKIFSIRSTPVPNAPLHPYCRCIIVVMRCVTPGGASHEGTNGADWWIAHYGMLPLYHLSKADFRALGWKEGKSPSNFAPGKMLNGGTFYNKNGHLPQAPSRVWYEADINYYQGRRDGHRLLWSNDGLIFVTYDHYETFIEVK